MIEYDGSNYHGWQTQNNFNLNDNFKTKTISDEVLKAIQKITGFKANIFVSGRTDAGVHALNQVANFHLPFVYDLDKFKIALNGVLPDDISVKYIEFVHDSFHATFDTVSKVYLYKINSGFKSSLLSNYSWYIKDSLNFELMKEASRVFIGEHNFINFAKIEKNRMKKNYFRTIIDINIYKKRYGFDILVEGEGFLRNMVRRIVGAIVMYACAKIAKDYLMNMLEGDKIISNLIKAPASGLFLYSIKYKHKIFY